MTNTPTMAKTVLSIVAAVPSVRRHSMVTAAFAGDRVRVSAALGTPATSTNQGSPPRERDPV